MDKHLDAEVLSDYAEGLADAHTRAAADAHLAGCAQCRRELADVQAYFREMADLEPARAPADFLSRVRARLPQPSPWEWARAALFIPFRFIPVPIAVGVIIGVTAITVYMRQGGQESRSVLPMPATGPASGSAEPATEPAPAVAADRPQQGPARISKAYREESASAQSKPRPAAKKGAESPRAMAAEPGPSGSAGSAGAPAVSRPPEVPAPSGFAPPAAPPPSAPPASAAVGSADTKPSSAKDAPARQAPHAQPPSAKAAQKLRAVESQGWSDRSSSVYILDNSSAPAELPLDKSMPIEERDAVPGQAEAAAGHAAAKRKDEEKSRAEESRAEAGGRIQPAPRKTNAPAVLPSSGYALSLRAKADTAAVLAGLRSMGVEAEPVYASPGEIRFRLSVPAPMLRELGPYLARHGESRAEGQIPSAPSDSVLSIRLRLLFPAR